MGDPIKIVTLAETLITLSGLTPGEDIEIVYTGLKPGEKMSEELSFTGEDVTATGLDKLWVLNDGGSESGMVAAAEKLLSDLPELGEIAARNRIAEAIPGYHPAGESDPVLPGTVDSALTQTQAHTATDT
jgi:FlaA1/EpsC-like NDP-sugar epimerase